MTDAHLPDSIRPFVGHLDDPPGLAPVLASLHALHGPDYAFGIRTWQGMTTLRLQRPGVLHLFVVETDNGSIALQPGDRVRGVPPDGPFQREGPDTARATDAVSVALRPGDVICLDAQEQRGVSLIGRGRAFAVTTAQSDYCPPRLALLRHLPDHPGGCAQYAGAFRREALPPQRAEPGAGDQRGANRVNEHTLDMRVDRTPGPIRHFHGPIPVGSGALVNHSETAIVLPRAAYGLPELDQPDAGHLILHPRPVAEPAATVRVPVRPGSIVVTPASTEQVMGHRFENCFAMLVAIPGFVAPYHLIEM